MATSYVISVATSGDKAIAGPLVAAALIYDTHTASPRFVWSQSKGRRPQSLSDFDGLPPARKERISDWLRQKACGFGIVTCTVRQLNEGDPREVRRTSMGRAVYRAVEHALFRDPTFRLSPENTRVVVSGLDTLPLQYVGAVSQAVHAERQGRPWQIDAAYAVARVNRDGQMRDAHRAHPEYEFILNNGYASLPHREALEQRGLTPFHRMGSPLVREVQAGYDN